MNMEQKGNNMEKQLGFVGIEDAKFVLYADDDSFIGRSDNPVIVANFIRKHGGGRPGWKTMSSSLFIEALAGSDDAAEEGGFFHAQEVQELWQEVCDYV